MQLLLKGSIDYRRLGTCPLRTALFLLPASLTHCSEAHCFPQAPSTGQEDYQAINKLFETTEEGRALLHLSTQLIYS